MPNITLPDDAYADDIIDAFFPYDGPHTHDQTVQAAQAIERLVRYLNNATGPGHCGSALPYAATAYRVTSAVAGAAGLLPQLLEQLETFFVAQAKRPDLYDDRYDADKYPAGRTASGAAAQLQEAYARVALLAASLRVAASFAGHLGNDESAAARIREGQPPTGKSQ